MGEASVKESEKTYTMELAAPGIKKEYCCVAINDEGNHHHAEDRAEGEGYQGH
ncbi:MAG: hypothetical protein J5965_14915 [Aeriscardovia sp.]|nr:hypothetical protein [Aeriscardovia sp.]